MTHEREAMLIEYSQQFKTQGNRKGNYWFLGIEEGGGGDEAEVDFMLANWERRGRSEIDSLNDPERSGKPGKWFDTSRRGGPPVQTTWGAQIRVLLSMLGMTSDREDVRRYQATTFGTPNGETCLMELLPLANPSLTRWIYNEISEKPQFASRDAFIDSEVASRIARFSELVAEHEPVSVVGVCYGLRHFLEPYLTDVEQVRAAGGRRPGRAVIGTMGSTVVAITYHPSTPMTAPNDWYAELGQLVAARSEVLRTEPLRYQLPHALVA